MEITMEYNIPKREAKLKAIKKDKVAQEKLFSSKIKLKMLTNATNKMMHIMDRKDKEYKGEVGAVHSKQPRLFTWEEQTQSLQGKSNNQNMHVELYCKEEDVESCQVSTVCLPTSCVSLLRENYKQISNRNRENCSEESIKGKIDDTNPFADPEVFPLSHLETTQSEIENESTPLGSLPLCFDSFQIIKIN